MSWSASIAAEGIPLIARIAGLPVAAVAPFAGPLPAKVARQVEVTARLAEVRTELVERLQAAVAGAPHDHRRLLLSMKRDSFNGRSLSRYRQSSSWEVVTCVLGPLAEAILCLEEEEKRLEVELVAEYATQAAREREALRPFLVERSFQRGLALSSPVLALNLPRLDQPGADARRVKRLELSLLRYVCRAALKLSPFSTLTRIGLALTTDSPEVSTLRPGDPASWHADSTLALQYFIYDQVADLLAGYPPFGDSGRVSRNETIAKSGVGTFTFIRPGYYTVDLPSAELRYIRPSQVSVELRGAPIDWLFQQPAARPRPYSQWLAELAAAFPERDAAALRTVSDRLLDLGFLCRERPWDVACLAPEGELLAHLERLETVLGDPHLGEVATALRRVVDLLAELRRTERPAALAAAAQAAARETLQIAARLAGFHLDVSPEIGRDWLLHEDVFLRSGAPRGEVAQISAACAQAVLDDLTPLSRLTNVYSSRHDFLLTLSAFAAGRWPRVREVPFLDLFAAAVPLFQSYVKWDIEVRSQGNMRPRVFDPLALPALAALKRCREELSAAVPAYLIDEGEDSVRLDLPALAGRLDQVPLPYRQPRDFCAFVQQSGEARRDWVLNLMSEGMRFSSRFTAAMDPAMRSRFTAFYAARALGTDDEGGFELVDIFCPSGHTANAHALQTPRALIAPGQSLDAAGEQCLTLADLTVRLGGPGSPPQLVDRRGRRLVPVHLGAVTFTMLPLVSKFLSLFGAGEIRPCAPLKRRRVADDLEVVARHTVGRVIYRRRTWSLEPAALRRRLERLAAGPAFAAINRWRLSHSLPERVFVAEPLPGAISRGPTKPQYVDFSSTLLVEIFRTALDRAPAKLCFAEALPDPQRAGGESRLAIEILLDSHAFTGVPSFALPTLGEGGFAVAH